jgi:hypothetical protein
MNFHAGIGLTNYFGDIGGSADENTWLASRITILPGHARVFCGTEVFPEQQYCV